MSHWFFVEPGAVQGERVYLSPEDAHHLVKVLRARPGEPFTAVTGGVAYRCTLVEAGAGEAWGRVESAAPVTSEPPIHLTVFQGLPKGEKLEQVIQHGTEVGVGRFVPVAAARSVVKLDAKKAASRQQRWQKIAREAAQQARRGKVPQVEPVQPWAAAARQAREYDLALVLWEEEAGRPGLREHLARLRPGARVALYVGPEGGLTADEVAAVSAAGGHSVGLGPRILRTETAALVAAAAVLYAAGDLGGTGPRTGTDSDNGSGREAGAPGGSATGAAATADPYAAYPPNYRRYFELFNNREFWEAHEALEELWQEDKDPFKQGLFVLAAAFVHVQRNNPSGCRKLLQRTLDFLTPFAPRHWDLDVDRVLGHARHCLELLDRKPPGQPLAGYIPFMELGIEPPRR